MNRMNRCTLLLCLLTCLAMTAATVGCGSDPQPNDDSEIDVARASVGPTGGTVEGEGVSLVVPASAVAEEVEISISIAEVEAPSDWDGVTKVYRFEPAGLEFDQPADIAFDFEGEDASQAHVLWSSDGGESWETLETTTTQTGVTAKVNHFSVGLVALPQDPGSADAGSADTGAPTDTGSTTGADAGDDYGEVDASDEWPEEDAGEVYVPDSGSSDAGSGSSDSGSSDAGSGSSDSGSGSDTGSTADAGAAEDSGPVLEVGF